MPFPVEESGRIYVNAMMTDDGMSRIDVAVSQPICGGETVASADVTLRITADGQPLELFRDAELSSDEVQSYYSEAQLYSGQRLVLEAHAEGLPEVRSEAVMPEAILRPEVVREEVISFKDEIPGQTMDSEITPPERGYGAPSNIALMILGHYFGGGDFSRAVCITAGRSCCSTTVLAFCSTRLRTVFSSTLSTSALAFWI